jgi:hypothetical protein
MYEREKIRGYKRILECLEKFKEENDENSNI